MYYEIQYYCIGNIVCDRKLTFNNNSVPFLQRLAVGRLNCGSIFICVFVFVCVLCLFIAVLFVAFIYIFFLVLFLFLLVMQIDKLHPDKQQKLKNVSAAYVFV